MYMTLYGRLVEPLEVGKISNNNIIHSFKKMILHILLILMWKVLIATADMSSITLDLHRDNFRFMDTTKDGFLDDDELATLDESNNDLDDLSPSDIVAFIVELDKNNDGKISWKEYEQTLSSDHGPTLEGMLPDEFEDVDGFVESARDWYEQQQQQEL